MAGMAKHNGARGRKKMFGIVAWVRELAEEGRGFVRAGPMGRRSAPIGGARSGVAGLGVWGELHKHGLR